MASARPKQDIPFGAAVVMACLGTAVLVLVLAFAAVPALWAFFAYRPVTATIVDRRLAEERRPKGCSVHHLEGLLSFTADGQEQRAWVRLGPSARQASGPEADEALAQVKVGEQRTVFYDPYDPAGKVVLDNPLEWRALLALLCPAAFLAFGVVGLRSGWRKAFPRGAAVEAAELLRRLPRRFYLALAGLLLPAGALVLILVNWRALGGWLALVLVGVGLAAWPLIRWVKRYGAVALPSPEKRAARSEPAPAPMPRSGTGPAGHASQGKGLPVRLRLNETSAYRGALSSWPVAAVVVVGFLAAALTGTVVRHFHDQTKPIPAPVRGTLLAGAIFGLVVGVALVALRAVRRVCALTVEASEHPLRPGGSCGLVLTHPSPNVLRALRAALVCVEELARGGKKGTTRRTALRLPVELGWPAAPGAPRRGRFSVPAGAAPSFQVAGRQVAWAVAVDFGRWFRHEALFPVTVEPPSAVGAAEGPPVRLDDGPVSLWIDHSNCPPGATLTGGFTVRPAGAGPLRTVELSVLWQTADGGPRQMGVCHFEEHEAPAAGDAPLYGTRSYRARLPEGPFSHDGPVIKIGWCVRLRLRCANGSEVLRELPFRLGAPGVARR